MKKAFLSLLLSCYVLPCFCWGFYAHRKINYYAVFLLPPEMMVLYKPHIAFLSDHAVDPDKRRYAIKAEGPRHFIDIDCYGPPPFPDLPRKWEDAVKKYPEDSLLSKGIVPWWVQVMQQRLTSAFREKNQVRILKISAELGHYIADAHVPLHACSNHNGQHTGQEGIHGFWESRLPELLAEKHWDFYIGKAAYIPNTASYIWNRVLESAAAADTVLRYEKELNTRYSPDRKYAFESRNGIISRQYSSEYSVAYDKSMQGMIERRMRESVYAVASFWFTAWVNAGQPNLKDLSGKTFTTEELQEFERLNESWKNNSVKGKSCE